MGLSAATNEVSVRMELDSRNKQGVQTMKQLKQKRSELDNRDIRVKTVVG